MKYLAVIYSLFFVACIGKSENKETPKESDNNKGKITLMTLNPGHFHAALVQKSMYKQVNNNVYVYAPKGPDIKDHLARIEGFNTREENPTQWVENVYEGNDYLQKMMSEKPGNVMVVSGKNNKKIEYIKAAIDAGIHVYADKPMVINPEGFKVLENIFKTAAEKGLLVYDIMTERFEITTILQRELSMNTSVFGTLVDGTPEKPAITKESVHHFFKYVSGKPLKRPDWFFDTKQRGEGLNDVSTHLVDLVQWEAFPNVILKKSDIKIINAKHWTTSLSKKMFKKVTGADKFPDFLKKDLDGELLSINCNGSIIYKIKGKIAKTSVIWNFQAPEGTGDTHYSIMRGTKCDLIIKQGAEENYKPKLYIKMNANEDESKFEENLKTAISTTINQKYSGVKLERLDNKTWFLDIPQEYKIGHEQHFEQVTTNFLKYLKEDNMPAWEIPNMIVKYYTTSEAFKFANKN
ncbi:putative oxidoreductase C-terminal domain-containing protein [Jejuia spongiicola]|uniref:Gfo/Idh/MocA family oxidoreductase n=1 Tax=Jejuia spongiicola TaxID=2942207 RepID=A0ABT0QG51_9FLAO|nr:putative oxidoreductase C-terminal domain-containing protein [Jejuia spongiicola]MCL6295956.1 Gfo/Idh/MocA family oxidoreductase [Jejuia spongiicola]